LVIVGSETGGRWLGGIDRQLRAAVLSLFVKQKMGSFISKENTADLQALAELVDSGAVTPAIDQTYPLAEAATAIDRLTSGDVRGKLVLTP
jgi:NADPH:quinone reductase-like Zn-dependent oxidoreductase